MGSGWGSLGNEWSRNRSIREAEEGWGGIRNECTVMGKVGEEVEWGVEELGV